MKSVLLNNVAVQTAINFRNIFDTNDIYLYVGKQTPWTNELSAPQPENTVADEITARNNIVALYKISKADVFTSLVRYDWTSGEVYTEYSDTSDSLFGGEEFYVYTNDGNVYKCISNNDGAPSTVPPIGTSVNTLVLSDGYQWKFMFNLSPTVSSKFLTSLYVPCPVDTIDKTSFQLAVEQAAQYTTNSPAGGHGKNASSELGASNLIVSITNTPDSNFPHLPEHRQYGIIINPLNLDGSPATESNYDVDSSNNTIDTMSGTVIFITNHSLVTPDSNGDETVQCVINFYNSLPSV